MGMLEGVRVLDLSRLVPGPACTWYLQGMGASVDRVEPPGAGDFTRHVPPFVDGVGSLFAALGRGKRSLALDLRKPAAVAALRAMLPRYDVLVEGFKPGVMEAMGLDPAELLARYPRLIVARISGYGQTGPWRDRPGHDLNFMGLSGALALAAPGPAGHAPLPVQIADLAGAQVAASGICAALFARERSGSGRVLDISLAEAALSFMSIWVPGATAEGRDPEPGKGILHGGVPLYGTYRCADGAWLTLGALEPKFQAALTAHTGGVSRSELEAAFATRPRDAWIADLAEACTSEVLGPNGLHEHPQLRERGAVVRLGQTTWVCPPFGAVVDEPLPRVGEHTDAILGEAGIDAAALRATGAAG